jgi:hypothetical protein
MVLDVPTTIEIVTSEETMPEPDGVAQVREVPELQLNVAHTVEPRRVVAV